MDQRPRARYSINSSLMGFSNPLRKGPVDRVSFCVVDTMYHIFFRYDPLRQDDNFYSIGKKIREANIKQNGTDPSPAVSESSGGGFIMSVWFPGSVDFEDLVAIVESVPELKAGWLRPAFEKFKTSCGLEKTDPPFFDRDINQGEGDAPDWYKGGWFSAKGGTVKLAELPDVLEDAFKKSGAILQPAVSSEDGFSLRFTWKKAQENTRKSMERIRAIAKSCSKTAPGNS